MRRTALVARMKLPSNMAAPGRNPKDLILKGEVIPDWMKLLASKTKFSFQYIGRKKVGQQLYGTLFLLNFQALK